MEKTNSTADNHLKLQISMAMVEVLRFIQPKQLLQLQLVNKKFYHLFVGAVLHYVPTFNVKEAFLVFPKINFYYTLSLNEKPTWITQKLTLVESNGTGKIKDM